MKASFVVVLAFAFVGCESSRQSASLTAEQANILATRLANDKAGTLYHCQPFRNSQPPRFEAGHWVWTDTRGIGTGDIQVRVELAADGSTNSVDIKLLDNKNPVSLRLF